MCKARPQSSSRLWRHQVRRAHVRVDSCARDYPSLIVAEVRRAFIWISLVHSRLRRPRRDRLAALFHRRLGLVGDDALNAHKTVRRRRPSGRGAQLLLVAFWRLVAGTGGTSRGRSPWRSLARSRCLVSAILVSRATPWVHGLHGGLVLFVVAFAAYIAHRGEARAVGFARTPNKPLITLRLARHVHRGRPCRSNRSSTADESVSAGARGVCGGGRDLTLPSGPVRTQPSPDGNSSLACAPSSWRALSALESRRSRR